MYCANEQNWTVSTSGNKVKSFKFSELKFNLHEKTLKYIFFKYNSLNATEYMKHFFSKKVGMCLIKPIHWFPIIIKHLCNPSIENHVVSFAQYFQKSLLQDFSSRIWFIWNIKGLEIYGEKHKKNKLS